MIYGNKQADQDEGESFVDPRYRYADLPKQEDELSSSEDSQTTKDLYTLVVCLVYACIFDRWLIGIRFVKDV